MSELTLAKLEELEEICKSATPEPWYDNTRGNYNDDVCVGTKNEEYNNDIIGGCGCCSSPWIKSEDRAFIIMARQYLPILIKELQELYLEFGW